jgi:DNA-directed RNA polymerase specialized sigma subunit
MTIAERNKLVEDNYKCIPAAAWKYAYLLPGYHIDDLIGIASVIITKAASHYDGRSSFPTFAYYSIKTGFMQRARDDSAQKRK